MAGWQNAATLLSCQGIMIRPQKNVILRWFFHRYILYIIGRNFRAVNFNEMPLDAHKSVLLLANHIGWWDGFLLYWLNERFFKKKFHVMVLEDTMRQVSFLKYMGAFSVVKKSRSMLESLQYAADLLHDPENLVLIFPQGHLYSNFVDDIHFDKGLMRIVKSATGQFQYVFAAMFIEYFEHRKPTVNIYNQTFNNSVNHIDDLKGVYINHYHQAKKRQTQIVL